MIEIIANGITYQFPEGTSDGEIAAAIDADIASQQSAQEPAAAPPPAAPDLARGGSQNQRTVIATTEDGGSIYELADGSRGYTSPGYSTTDPEAIARLMEGAKPAQIVQDSFDNQRLDANPGRARLNEFARGVPFVGSYIDEAVGALGGSTENLRSLSGAMQRQNPGETLGLNLAGAVAGSVPMMAAAVPTLIKKAGATVGARALQGFGAGVALGASEGAIYNAGEGTEGNRGSRAKTGALIGGAAGGILGALAPYGAEGIKALIGRFKGAGVPQIATQLGVSRAAAQELHNAFRSGDMAQAQAALARAGDNSMLADAGDAASTMLDGAAQAGGRAGQIANTAVNDRARAATGQMNSVLDDILGAPQGQRDLVDSIRTGSAPARKTAYDAAYAAPIDYANPRGRRLEGLLARVPASAVRRAEELMRLEGVQSSQILARIDGDRVTFETLPDVRQIDYITRAMNDVADVADGQGKLGGTTNLGRVTSDLAGSIRQNLRQAVPAYGRALDVASDAITERKAVDLGYNLFSTRREDVVRGMHRASAAQKASVRQGIRSYVDEVTSRVTRTVGDSDTEAREGIKILRDFSSRGNADKLRTVLGPRQADALLSEIDEAATTFELRAAIALNSKTAARTAFREGVEGQANNGIVRTLAAFEPVNATKRFVQALTGETEEARRIRELGIYEEIATILTETKGGQARNALRMIDQAINGQSLNEAQARIIATAITSSAVLSGDRAASLTLQ